MLETSDLRDAADTILGPVSSNDQNNMSGLLKVDKVYEQQREEEDNEHQIKEESHLSTRLTQEIGRNSNANSQSSRSGASPLDRNIKVMAGRVDTQVNQLYNHVKGILQPYDKLPAPSPMKNATIEPKLQSSKELENTNILTNIADAVRHAESQN